jgi:hypothetical protein
MNISKSERKYISTRRNNLTRGYNSDKIVLHGKTKIELEREFDSINDEEILACFIHNDENVLRFAFSIMYKTIKKANEIGIDAKQIIHYISENNLENDINMIKKPGFTKNEATKIFKAVLEHDEETVFSQIEKNKFHQIMGSYYLFTINTTFILGILELNKELKKNVMKKIKELFCLPDNYDDDKINGLLIEENKWLYLDIFTYGSTCPESLYRKNMLNLPYIRNKVTNTNVIKAISPTKCHKNALNNKEGKIIQGNSWYSVEDNMFFAKLLKSFNRKYIAGPSGSAVLAYIFVFTFLNFEKTKLNERLLLSCIIGDYIPYYHSLTEILMTYSFEINIKYNISIDPVNFAKNLIKPCLAISENQDTIVGGKKKTKKIMNKKAKI